MSVTLIFNWKGKTKPLRTRSETEKALREAGWGQSLTDEQLDKTKFIEKNWKEKHGAEGFVHQDQADKVR